MARFCSPLLSIVISSLIFLQSSECTINLTPSNLENFNKLHETVYGTRPASAAQDNSVVGFLRRFSESLSAFQTQHSRITQQLNSNSISNNPSRSNFASTVSLVTSNSNINNVQQISSNPVMSLFNFPDRSRQFRDEPVFFSAVGIPPPA